MIDRLHHLAKGPIVAILLVLDFIMMIGVMPYMGRRMKALAPDATPLDIVIPTYSTDFAHEMVAAYGEAGRAFYKSIELGADIAYPLIYGFAFSLLLAYLWPRIAPGTRWLRWLPLIPLAGMLFDFGENIAIVTLLSQYPAQPDGLARLAGFFSLMKWVFAFITIGLVLTGLNGLLIRWLQSR